MGLRSKNLLGLLALIGGAVPAELWAGEGAAGEAAERLVLLVDNDHVLYRPGTRRYRLREFTSEDAIRIESDSLRHVPVWRKAKPGDLPLGLYSLRLHLKGDATVYALKLRKSASAADSR